MRQLRILRQGVWYSIRSRINNREPLFRRSTALGIFSKVFRETEQWFVFTVRGLRLEDDWLTFYIKPENGMELPMIMKWLKQTFAQRYNRQEGRIGHIWGDRYGSEVMEGNPPEEKETSTPGGGTAPTAGVRPYGGKNAKKRTFPRISPLPATPSPG
jgi:REP element-mobilizing transposase RayT